MWKTLFSTTRPPFLILAPLCVSIALAYATYLNAPVTVLDVVMCYLAALFAHASVNMYNEYQDYISGLDSLTERTPFSGGSGTLQSMPMYANQVRLAARVLLGLTVCIGLYFVTQHGLPLLVLGLAATLCVVGYTPVINQYPAVCLFAPGFGFGVVLTLGSFIAMTGTINTSIALLTLPVCLLTNNLLLLNQFPDKKADTQSGRNHLIICYGEHAGKTAYLIQLAVVAMSILVMIHWFHFSLNGMLLILPVLAGLISYIGLQQYLATKNINAFVPFLAANVIATLSYPVITVYLLLDHVK